MSVVLDISRLISRSRFGTPTGIDRFELSYASWIVDRFGSDVRFVAGGPFGHRGIADEPARSLISSTTVKWGTGDGQSDETASIEQLVEQIEAGAGGQSMPRPAKVVTPRQASWPGQSALKSMAALFWASSSLPASSLFVHVSHSGLHREAAFRWLAHRACLPVFYVHDLIPLLRPEFSRAGEAERHRARIQTILRYHRLIICNSETTARTLDELAKEKGMAQPFTAVLPPGLERTFLRFDPAARVRTTQPYFVCLGTIEPRKNHALLLEAWRNLVQRYGSRAPRLVIVGRRGWDNTHIFSVLNDPAAFQGTVIEVSGLNDQSVARLLSGASALLAPSHIEGYGMPVAEALALGTPVIASNIRAHREVSRGRAVLIDTLDGVGWLSAVESHAKWPRRIDHCEQRNWTWKAHFDALNRLLMSAKLVPSTEPASLPTSVGGPWRGKLVESEPCQLLQT